jgi:hypothetical protein
LYVTAGATMRSEPKKSSQDLIKGHRRCTDRHADAVKT